MNKPDETTLLLQKWQSGDRDAESKVCSQLLGELRRIAQNQLQNERSAHTLQPTALVNEAYLRLVKQKNFMWQNKHHFIGVAAGMIRHILIDYARIRNSKKRGEGDFLITLNPEIHQGFSPDLDFLALHEAMSRLEQMDHRQAKIVELKFFGGLSIPEIAEVLSTSASTIKREWRFARAWMQKQLSYTKLRSDKDS